MLRVQGGFKGWLSLPFDRQYRARKFDTLVCPAFPPSPFALHSKIPVARIIHDDFPWTRTHTLNVRGRMLFKHIETWMAPRYKPLVAPTKPMAENLATILARDVGTIGNAPGLNLSAAPMADRRVPRLIAVGTVEPRKNYDAVLAVTSRLPESWSVAVVGRKGWGQIADDWDRHIEEQDGRLAWHGHASDEALLGLYQTSTCFVSMSLAEGFNMPLVEAGSLGLPVVCSDIAIHRQVAPPWARFVPLTITPDALADVILEASTAMPAEPDVAAYRSQFSWQAIARALESEMSHA